MLETVRWLNILKKVGSRTTCSPSTIEEMESDMIDVDETTIDDKGDQEIMAVKAIEKINNEG